MDGLSKMTEDCVEREFEVHVTVPNSLNVGVKTFNNFTDAENAAKKWLSSGEVTRAIIYERKLIYLKKFSVKREVIEE